MLEAPSRPSSHLEARISSPRRIRYISKLATILQVINASRSTIEHTDKIRLARWYVSNYVTITQEEIDNENG